MAHSLLGGSGGMLPHQNFHHVRVLLRPSPEDKGSQFAGQKIAMLLFVSVYLSYVRTKNTAQSLLRDVGRCCKEAPLHCGGMGCAVVQQASN